MSELKACPFCGHPPAEQRYNIITLSSAWVVCCAFCKACGPSSGVTEGDAATVRWPAADAEWNRRAPGPIEASVWELEDVLNYIDGEPTPAGLAMTRAERADRIIKALLRAEIERRGK